MRPGAFFDGNATTFRVWAPRPHTLELELVAPRALRLPMQPVGGGLFEARVEGVAPGTRYCYLLDGERRRPDPAGRALPDGVHGPSLVDAPSLFAWQHPRRPRRMDELVIYELHIGTFTAGGTFDSTIGALDRLIDLGVTAVEILPVASFSGVRNWGYDGVGWFAPQQSYGGPDGLRRLIDACHARGLSFILDCVYNHFGPEGNYVGEFAPWNNPHHKTPWGDAIDYDGENAAPVRAHVLENVRMWVDDYRVDGLRIDAVHTICDHSPRHIVADIAALAHAHGAITIAESDLGDVKVISGPDAGGWGCDAQWSDDFHHALHSVVTGERKGYYEDFGALEQLATSLREGFIYTGQHSRHRRTKFGTPSVHLPGERFVICSQNHDQIGNRAIGERLAQLAPGCQHAVAATCLLAPAVPLIFMGEEHADPAPFLYFTDHQDAHLAELVRDGRKREFPMWDPCDVPDPQAPETYERAKINLALGERGHHAGVRRFYKALLRLRRERPELAALDKRRVETFVDEEQGAFAFVRRSDGARATAVIVSLRGRPISLSLPETRGQSWRLQLDAGDPEFSGPAGTRLQKSSISLAPWGAVVLVTG